LSGTANCGLTRAFILIFKTSANHADNYLASFCLTTRAHTDFAVRRKKQAAAKCSVTQS
jgi:hypothetical protein